MNTKNLPTDTSGTDPVPMKEKISWVLLAGMLAYLFITK